MNNLKESKKNVAVVLSGCGVFDGTEIHEAVLTLLAIEEEDADWHCFAPKIDQMHIINHNTGEEDNVGTRNVLSESSRISRGSEKLSELSKYDPKHFDCLIFPGGFGAAKNLSDFALKGHEATPLDSVSSAVRSTHALGKPIGFICISPASIGAPILGDLGVSLTIGNDPDTASAINACGAAHLDCSVEDIVVDKKNKVVSTPAYMLGPGIRQVRSGISKLVAEVLVLAD